MKITTEIRNAIARENGIKSARLRKKKLGKNYRKAMKQMSIKGVEARRKLSTGTI